jgi:hypothetical protein
VQPNDTEKEDRKLTQLAQGVRIDLIIAICALLASSLATAASWYQTHVVQEQLSAQTWPYIQITTTTSESAVTASIDNPGLGPAVLRTFSVDVDGKPVANVIDVLHAILGPKIRERTPPNDGFSLANLNAGKGAVVRAGDSVKFFALTSKHFARPLAKGLRRVSIHVCYCAILSGRCWLIGGDGGDPQQLNGCPAVADDWLGNTSESTTTEF